MILGRLYLLLPLLLVALVPGCTVSANRPPAMTAQQAVSAVASDTAPELADIDADPEPDLELRCGPAIPLLRVVDARKLPRSLRPQPDSYLVLVSTEQTGVAEVTVSAEDGHWRETAQPPHLHALLGRGQDLLRDELGADCETVAVIGVYTAVLGRTGTGAEALVFCEPPPLPFPGPDSALSDARASVKPFVVYRGAEAMRYWRAAFLDVAVYEAW